MMTTNLVMTNTHSLFMVHALIKWTESAHLSSHGNNGSRACDFGSCSIVVPRKSLPATIYSMQLAQGRFLDECPA